MKQLTCEMCGSNELLKKDGLYVCTACGTKYTVEEARNLFVEGKVEVSGTVSIDDSQDVKNYIVLARRAKKVNDYSTAKDWYSKYLLKFPNNSEAYFYSSYYGLLVNEKNIPITSQSLISVIQTTFKLMREDPDASPEMYKDISNNILHFQPSIVPDSFHAFQIAPQTDKIAMFNKFQHTKDLYMQSGVALINCIIEYYKDYRFANSLLISMISSFKYYRDDQNRYNYETQLNSIRTTLLQNLDENSVAQVKFGLSSTVNTVIITLSVLGAVILLMFILFFKGR
ncbi:MAG: hypothetical protein MJ131_04605 [Lachnospiraceae bacterium]|nr:hypothetical protein [Lachnospiraceae bacterium]